ncbi:MAG: DNA repair protein [Eggerthellaceae bacterium]|nr:DNA repair protein [Eggerthellaceae bacterium]
MTGSRTYIAIDLKSFYASVECVERGLNPLTTNLVVADESRTNKTICLAVSPALKSFGVPGRPRLFEVEQIVARVNEGRARKAPGGRLRGQSHELEQLQADGSLGVDYLVAVPRMAHYMAYSTRIYQTYLKYIAPEDIHVYSIDEVFIDATDYLRAYGMTGRELAMTMIRDVLATTGITATAGVGTNLYLAKVAMDIEAKHMPADENGVRIAELDELSYREALWTHKPITDFWRVGKGYARRLAKYGIRTMGDVARLSLTDEDLLYREFGINAELLIDHAWGWEPCTMADIKAYRPAAKSLMSGQVLMEPYTPEKARVVLREMADALVLDIVSKALICDGLSLTVNYDSSSDLGEYEGEMKDDWYGRRLPKPAVGTASFDHHTSSTSEIVNAALKLFDEVVNPCLLVRRMSIGLHNLIPRDAAENAPDGAGEQLDLFGEYEERQRREETARAERARERQVQEAILDVKERFGKNALLRGTNLKDGATGRDRNRQVGGHRV